MGGVVTCDFGDGGDPNDVGGDMLSSLASQEDFRRRWRGGLGRGGHPLLPRQGRVLLALSKSSNFGVLGPETERTG